VNQQHKDMAIEYFKRLVFNHLPNDVVCWVAGGSLRDYFTEGKVNSDFDVFFPDVINFNKAHKALLKDKKIKEGWSDSNISNFIDANGNKIQLISAHYFPNPSETIANFDFTIACGAIDTKEIYLHEDFFEDLAARRLVINNLPFPLSTLERMQKYIKKGYSICNGGLLKICNSIRSLDLNNPKNNQLEFYANGDPRFMRMD